MKHPQLILASSSPARRALLARLPIPFEYISPEIDETPLPGEDIHEMVLRLAEEKARKIHHQFPEAYIIGCDQVGLLNTKILAKPLTHDKAVEQLTQMSGQHIRFFTAICLLDAKHDRVEKHVEVYDVYFRELTEEMIENYLQIEKPYQCAGSFQAEGLGIALISEFKGKDYTSLIGLPLIRLISMLENAGIHII